jgi:DNA topoisomerase-1
LPKNVYLKYGGKKLELSLKSEEIATFYASMLNTEYIKKKIFNKNFFKDWRDSMSTLERSIVTNLDKCDFSKIADYLQEIRLNAKQLSKEEKKKEKEEQEKIKNKYGYCILDGHKQQIANFRLEPPGLFRGRGEHPKMGKVKSRTHANDVTINIGENETCKPPKGENWENVIHDHNVIWLCSWVENILGKRKYIMLNQSSALRGEKDLDKYELARKLHTHIDDIRKIYEIDFKSKEMFIRQRAVALYLIDKLSLRAGNEKDSDQADTVGVCTLRIEHVKLKQDNVIELKFLGKDSIEYKNSIAVPKQVYKNFKFFTENKRPCDSLFDKLNTTLLNKYLQELMPGLTAKVFRTYNASITLERQLYELTKNKMSDTEKILAYNSANRQVAVLCNHQKMTKTSPVSIEKLQQKIATQKSKIKNITDKDKLMKENEKLKILKLKLKDKKDNASVALGTSKLNYLDPRITVAWCKKFNIPINKIFTKVQQDKFKWAMEISKNFKF